MSRKVTQSSDYDFQVETVRLLTPEGNKSSVFLNRRVDNREELGTCTEHYGLVQNADLINRADEALDRRGMTDYERKISVTDNGSKLRAIYDFKRDADKLVVPEVGDEMGFRLIVQNSFDRSLKVSFALGFLRLACTNGMTTLERELDMVKRHTKKIDINSLLTDQALGEALAKFDDAANVYTEIARKDVTQQQGLNVLQNLQKKNVFSEKVREGIASIWNNPRRDEDGKAGEMRNLYQLYNAGTEWLTSAHHTDSKGNELGTYESRRFELANRVSTSMLKTFEASSRTESRFNRLILAPKSEAIVQTA